MKTDRLAPALSVKRPKIQLREFQNANSQVGSYSRRAFIKLSILTGLTLAVPVFLLPEKSKAGGGYLAPLAVLIALASLIIQAYDVFINDDDDSGACEEVDGWTIGISFENCVCCGQCSDVYDAESAEEVYHSCPCDCIICER